MFISFKKLKIFSDEISWNNIRSDLAVKWRSLISIKSEQVSKICPMIINLWINVYHIRCTLAVPHPSVWKNGQCAIGPSQSLLFCLSEDKQYILLTPGISYVIYFPGTHPTQTATVLIYTYLCMILGLKITLLMWPPQPETKLNHSYNLVCIGKILLPLLLTRFGLE